jgi:hypothetical protein
MNNFNNFYLESGSPSEVWIFSNSISKEMSLFMNFKTSKSKAFPNHKMISFNSFYIKNSNNEIISSGMILEKMIDFHKNDPEIFKLLYSNSDQNLIDFYNCIIPEYDIKSFSLGKMKKIKKFYLLIENTILTK